MSDESFHDSNKVVYLIGFLMINDFMFDIVIDVEIPSARAPDSFRIMLALFALSRRYKVVPRYKLNVIQ